MCHVGEVQQTDLWASRRSAAEHPLGRTNFRSHLGSLTRGSILIRIWGHWTHLQSIRRTGCDLGGHFRRSLAPGTATEQKAAHQPQQRRPTTAQTHDRPFWSNTGSHGAASASGDPESGSCGLWGTERKQPTMPDGGQVDSRVRTQSISSCHVRGQPTLARKEDKSPGFTRTRRGSCRTQNEIPMTGKAGPVSYKTGVDAGRGSNPLTSILQSRADSGQQSTHSRARHPKKRDLR